MIKNNTGKFWDQKIETEYKYISLSPIFRDKNKIVVRWLSKLKGRLLNIGIGYGILETELRKSNCEIELYGIDISKKAIAWARANIK